MKNIFGSRDLAETGYEQIKGKLMPGFSGVFEAEGGCRFVGVVEEDGVAVRKYSVVTRESDCLLTCQITNEVFALVTLEPLCILDTHSTHPTSNLRINLFKFGTITLLNSYTIYSYLS